MMYKRIFVPLFFLLLMAIPAYAQDPTPDPNLTAADYIARGDQAVERRRYEAALTEYGFAIQLDPESVEAYNKRAQAYILLEQYDLALADYQMVTEIDADDPLAFINIGRLQVSLEKYDEAVAAYDEAIKLDDKNAEVYNLKGEALLAQENFEDAVTALQTATELNSDFALAYSNLGWAYYHLEDYPAAITTLNKAIQLAPEDSMAYARRAFAYIYRGDFQDAALEDANMAVTLDRNNLWAYFSRGNVYVEDFLDFNKAVTDFGQVIRLDPEFVEGYKERAVSYARSGRARQGLADILKVLELREGTSDDYYWLGRIYNSTEDFWRAIQAFEHALELQPEPDLEARIYYHTGVSYSSLAAYDKAIEYFDLSLGIEENPYPELVYTDKGIAYYLNGDMANAITNFEEALKINPDDWLSMVWLGDVYYDLVEYDKALDYYQRYVELVERPDSFVTRRIRELERMGVGEPLP